MPINAAERDIFKRLNPPPDPAKPKVLTEAEYLALDPRERIRYCRQFDQSQFRPKAEALPAPISEAEYARLPDAAKLVYARSLKV